ncbi:hypothetical protein ABBQ32_009020 [Trebouxia sp. C0010 RCD-2024]
MQSLVPTQVPTCPMCKAAAPAPDCVWRSQRLPSSRCQTRRQAAFSVSKQVTRRQSHLRSATEVKNEESQTDASDDGMLKEGEVYEVELVKPLGIRFARGSDGGAYVTRSDPNLGNTDTMVQPGDKILKVSASFGNDIWDAINYGQVMYAIKTRNGQVYMQLKSNGGDISVMQEAETPASKQFKQERSGGDYGEGTREMQSRNYITRKENERKRREMFDDALDKFKQKDIEGALVLFEEVLGMEPPNYLGDDFSRITQIFRVSQYNISCCYSAMNQVDAGLDALEAALRSGFEQFNKVREDPNLDNLRKNERFDKIVNQYDEKVIDFSGLKNFFGFGKKKS